MEQLHTGLAAAVGNLVVEAEILDQLLIVGNQHGLLAEGSGLLAHSLHFASTKDDLGGQNKLKIVHRVSTPLYKKFTDKNDPWRRQSPHGP